MYVEIMKQIIEKKHIELGFNVIDESDPLWKSSFFEANAIGQIGHNFLINVLDYLNIQHNNQKDGEHDEYDLISNNKKIEIKTARKGKKTNTFQFNGLNPKYNYDFAFFLGIKNHDIKYKLINKGNIYYDHSERCSKITYSVNGTQKTKKLVNMNPGNAVNNKLTLNWSEMDSFDSFENDIRNYLDI